MGWDGMGWMCAVFYAWVGIWWMTRRSSPLPRPTSPAAVFSSRSDRSIVRLRLGGALRFFFCLRPEILIGSICPPSPPFSQEGHADR